MKKTAAVSVAVLAGTADAWSINGHLYVANIAERLLEEKSPSSLIAAYDMLGYLQDYVSDRDYTWREDEHALVESSTFTDDWKYRGEAWQGAFHYINIPWVDEGTEDDYNIIVKEKNIVGGSNDIIAWLSGKQGDAYMDSYIYKYLTERKFPGQEDVAKSYALRMLIHQIGDIVQPLHAMNRYTYDYLKGDSGGNKFKLPYRYGVKNLHSLWDKVLYKERKNIRRPFSPETWDAFQLKVDEVMAEHADVVADPAVYASVDMQDWADDSYEIAKTLYRGVTEYEKVPTGYLKRNTPLAYERIMIGGYRLYYALDYIFNPDI